MPPHTLRFTSPLKAFRLTEPCEPYSETIDGWTISEKLQPHSDPQLAKEGTFEYYLVLEKSIVSTAELTSGLNDAVNLANQIEQAWCYAAGRPFQYMKIMVRPLIGPTGWAGNYEELRETLEREANRGHSLLIHWNHRQWSTSPFLPLRLALEVRGAILQASPILRQLIEIHVDAFKLFGPPRYVLLAKALEIAGAYYQGDDRSRAARNEGLQKLMASMDSNAQLTKTIEWLFDVSNTRREIRHAWDHGTTSLHRALSDDERAEFVKNADLVVRAFICKHLGIPTVIYNEKL